MKSFHKIPLFLNDGFPYDENMTWKTSEWKTLIWVLPSCLHWCARAKFLSKFEHFLPNSLSTCFVPNLFPCSFDFLRTKWNAFWWQITPRLLVCHQNPDSGVLNRVTTFCINFCSSSALIGAIQLCCVTAHCAVHNAYFVQRHRVITLGSPLVSSLTMYALCTAGPQGPFYFYSTVTLGR